jgi:hypothetical protein
LQAVFRFEEKVGGVYVRLELIGLSRPVPAISTTGWFSIPRAQHTVQIECCADQCKMGKCLREIAECLALRSGLL